MTHPTEGQLRAQLDHALDETEHARLAAHLAACADCRARAQALQIRATRIAAQFAALESTQVGVPHAALVRFKNRFARKEISLMQKIFKPRYRLAWTLVALVALFAVSLALPPVRAWAEGLLAQFRVAKITVVSVDATRFNELLGGTALDKRIGELLSDSVTVTKKPGAARSAANAAEASQLAGFTVRLPASRADAPQISAQDGGAFQFVVNRARAQSLLNEAGASDLKLPATIDGAVIKVTIPSAVTAAYGTCPKLDSKESESRAATSRAMANCILVSQIPSPVVDTPPDFDIAQIAQLGLQFAGMPKDQARAFAQTVDWTSTLVVPIPRNAAQYKKIAVDGAEGYLIQRPLDDYPQYTIIWVKRGIVYAVSGIGADTTTALNMANSLK